MPSLEDWKTLKLLDIFRCHWLDNFSTLAEYLRVLIQALIGSIFHCNVNFAVDIFSTKYIIYLSMYLFSLTAAAPHHHPTHCTTAATTAALTTGDTTLGHQSTTLSL
ncbi:hypothetical protein LguiB_001652 [Lonicera macranthoides]